MKSTGFCCLMFILLFLPCSGLAQETITDTTALFDLIIYGKDFDKNEAEVYLKSNPSYGGSWQKIGMLSANNFPESKNHPMILSGIVRDRYFGQDIRENHLSLKLIASDYSDGLKISAVYVVPHGEGNKAETITKRIIENPQQFRITSLASYVRPRPVVLKKGDEFIENIEAPVRHKKPGVLEVEWLEILFTNR